MSEPNGSTMRRVLTARGLRAFDDGYVSLLLPVYLIALGLSPFHVGVIATATLLGSAALSLLVGLHAHRFGYRTLLLAAAALMAATGFAFAAASDFWPLLVIAIVGTLNPSSGDVSVFLPLEQAVLANVASDRGRTALFARYSLVGTLMGALGALAASVPDLVVHWTGIRHLAAMQLMFALYGALGIVALLLYRPLSPAVEASSETPRAPLRQSRGIVYGLMALFSIDAFGSGFFVQSLLALWLYRKFGLSVSTTAAILFWSSICSAISYLLAVPISKRIGLINTMVFTHLPSNFFLILVPFAPNLGTAIALLYPLARLMSWQWSLRRSARRRRASRQSHEALPPP